MANKDNHINTLPVEMPPGIRPGEIPPFHRIGEYVFQELCRDLLDVDPNIAVCEIYGVRGQSQDGIDLLARRKNNDGIEVGQCKCYEDFLPHNIRDASDEFFAHWDERWSKENVRRFILFVACDLSNRNRQDKISKQIKRFADVGIIYEAWSAAKIRNKLAPHVGIVSRYFSPPEYWVKVICGVASSIFLPTGPSESQISTIVSGALITQLDQYAAQIKQLIEGASSEVAKNVELMRADWREGREDKVIEWLKGLRSNHALWQALSSEVKADLLRFEANLELEITGDVNRARQLAEDAQGLIPSVSDVRLQALITYIETGPKAAVKLLNKLEDIGSLNLKATLLLEMGRIDKCREILSSEIAITQSNAETFRIRALFYLLTKNFNQSRLEIQKALELEPHRENNLFTAAVIDYFSALSPAILPDCLAPWPEPIDWVLVKRDDESLMRLRDAERKLEGLIEGIKRRKERRQSFESWRLACLANDPDRQEEAAIYCQTILNTYPASYPAVMWAIARGFKVELEPSIKAFEELVTHRSATISHIHGLTICYLASQRVKEALKLLEATKSLFQKCKMDAPWSYYYAQVLIINGDPDAALKVIDSSGLVIKLGHAKTMALQAIANNTGDWQGVIQHLESSYQETGDPNFLFEYCEIMAQQQNWPAVADRAEQLIEEINTSEALRLAAIATFNTRRYELCLILLDSHRSLFEQQKFPHELRRIRALCQQNLGSLPRALAEQEAIVKEYPTAENILTLANLYFTSGDLKGLAITARQLIDLPGLTPEQLLQVAQLVQLEDQELAKAFWRKAMEQDLPDEVVVLALTIGFRLGLDSELDSLQRRIAELGQQGRCGVLKVAFEDLITFFKQQHKNEAKLNEFYRGGTIPIQLIAEQLKRPLSDFYYWFLEQNETAPDPIRQSSILIRHGGRGLMDGFPDSAPQWRLHLDATAVLLAAHLEILPEVERAFMPLHIPSELIPALTQMRLDLSHVQLQQLQSLSQIIGLVDRNSLKVVHCTLPPGYENSQLITEIDDRWVALYECAHSSGNYLVDFLPLKKRDLTGPPSTMPESADRCLINCRAVVEALRLHGPLSEEEYKKALSELGSEGMRPPSKVIPERGTSLFCHGTIPEVLARANLLNIVCEHFQVHIEQSELDRVRGELQDHERRRKEGKWLGTLIDKLRKGISEGTYETITPFSEEEEPENASRIQLEYRCLLSLLQFQPREGDVIWVDDRYANSYFYRDSVPIIGINEVLKALVSAGSLKENDYYRKLNRLRAANVRFIPIQKDEILYHLRQAKIDNGMLIETRELSILRRSIAACLVQGEIIQQPTASPKAPNKNGEIAFVMSLGRAIVDAIVDVWKAEEDDEVTCQARSEWIMTNLFIEDLGLLKLTSPTRSHQDDRYLVALSLAGLISQAITFMPNLGSGKSPGRRKYLDWLFNRILRKRIEIDPHLIAPIAEILKNTILRAQEEEVREESSSLDIWDIWLLQAFCRDLPSPIQEELMTDTGLMASIGFKQQITIDDLHFDPNEFYRAASEAVNGREAKAISIKPDAVVIFNPCHSRQGRRAFRFNHPVTGEERIVSKNGLNLLSDSPSERETALRKDRHGFDCPNEIFDQLVAEIASTEDFQKRLDKAELWRHASATVYYAGLYQKLKDRQPIASPDLLPPSTDGLLRHFRLDPDIGTGQAFQDALTTAAQTLICEENLTEAINRLVGFPFPLPAVVVESIADLPPKDRHSLIKQLLRIAGSPVSKIHFVHILLHVDSNGCKASVYHRLARRVITNLLSDKGTAEFDAFLAILNWVSNQFGRWFQARSWSPHIRLAMIWAHAHRILSIFVSTGVSIPHLRDIFSGVDQGLSLEIFDRDPDYWLDITHPRRVSREAFLLSGLSYSIGQAIECVDKKLQDRFTAIIVPTSSEGGRLPSLALLRDPTQARNCLNSFLGGDSGEKLSPLLGAEDAGIFARSSLQAGVENAVNRLGEACDDPLPWGRVQAVLGDLPPYEDLTDRLKAIIHQTNFVGLFEKDLFNGIFVIQTVTSQAINVGDEALLCYLKDQLVRIAKFLEAEECSVKGSLPIDKKKLKELKETYPLVLLDSALSLSIAAQPSKEAVVEFADLLAQLVQAWNSIIPVVRPMVQCLCEDLPIPQCQQFWPLLVRLRAE